MFDLSGLTIVFKLSFKFYFLQISLNTDFLHNCKLHHWIIVVLQGGERRAGRRFGGGGN